MYIDIYIRALLSERGAARVLLLERGRRVSRWPKGRRAWYIGEERRKAKEAADDGSNGPSRRLVYNVLRAHWSGTGLDTSGLSIATSGLEVSRRTKRSLVGSSSRGMKTTQRG